ncbi:hypothetical protein EJ05DRAFT_329792 [Pseudovirgaria hyperparasitica]|uniref:Uncharacterized protein n=1 Tax=Pseudovirgaria hyperparasitica TaxID=470096 RepID=A0A6A6WAP8_9PEZI|nr:uncharacterized protein EJ05DRAFT_329792 [Pseudovirgaria hyperparasitica]KAF2759030.1 hypothetical protein EJ05DRAFT_329792 [Pseudovirgaria hyperparasitica]
MTGQQSKADIIEERKANLPLPEQPPVASDFNSSDARTVNVGSGGISADSSESGLRNPATADSSVRTDGGDTKTNTAGLHAGRVPGGLPSDALAGKAKDSSKATETRGEDYGYPSKSDPAHK